MAINTISVILTMSEQDVEHHHGPSYPWSGLGVIPCEALARGRWGLLLRVNPILRYIRRTSEGQTFV